jgi:probable HAF family extracellular repeat protein
MVVVAVTTAISGTFGWHAYEGSAASAPRVQRASVRDLNNRGQVTGTLWLTNGVRHAFVWRRGSLQLLGRNNSQANAINDRGQILGYDGGKGGAVLWEHGKTRSLGRLSDPALLNNRGQVLGFYQGHPALWTNGKISPLPLTMAPAMNDEGQVVGQAADGQAAEWQDGKLTELGFGGYGWAINNHGEILGLSDSHDVIVWQNGTTNDLGQGDPVAINERGQVTGIHDAGATPFVWQNGTMTDLNGFSGGGLLSNHGQVVVSSSRGDQAAYSVWQNGTITRLSGYRPWNELFPVAINDHNQIIAQACATDCIRDPGREFAVLWTLKKSGVTRQQILPRPPHH